MWMRMRMRMRMRRMGMMRVKRRAHAEATSWRAWRAWASRGELGGDDIDERIMLRAAGVVSTEEEAVLVAPERREADVAPFVLAASWEGS